MTNLQGLKKLLGFKQSRLEELMLRFFDDDGMQSLAKFQMSEQAKQQEILRLRRIKERCDYFTSFNMGELTSKQKDEYRFCRFMVKKHDL